MKIDFKKLLNSKVAVGVATVAIIILFFLLNDSYRKSKAIVKENEAIKQEVVIAKEREKQANIVVANYRNEIAKKDGLIISLKTQATRNQQDLAKSQTEAKRLAANIAKIKNVDSSNVVGYVKNCDSLAAIVPILSDQIDTATAIKDRLVVQYEQKDQLKDSVIAKKDEIILSNGVLLDKTVNAYNRSVSQLVIAEKQVKKEKRAKKLLIAGVAVLTGLLIAK